MFSELGSNLSNLFGSLGNNLKIWFSDLSTNLGGFFKDLGTNLSKFFSDLSTNLGGWFQNVGDWFSDLGNNIGNFFANMLNGIKEFFAGIPEFFKSFWESLKDFFKSLFVPGEDVINGFVNSVKSHFGFVDTIKDTAKTIEDMFSDSENLPKITLTLPENKWYNGQIVVMDLSWYSQYKQYGDLIISAFIYVFFLWRIFVNLPNIISGDAGAINDVSISSSDIEAYSKFGFGRRSSLERHQR